MDTLLLEDGSALLLEDGGRLLLESATVEPTGPAGRIVRLAAQDRSVVALPAADRSTVSLRAEG